MAKQFDPLGSSRADGPTISNRIRWSHWQRIVAKMRVGLIIQKVGTRSRGEAVTGIVQDVAAGESARGEGDASRGEATGASRNGYQRTQRGVELHKTIVASEPRGRLLHNGGFQILGRYNNNIGCIYAEGTRGVEGRENAFNLIDTGGCALETLE